ncbi:Transcription factor MYB46 [Hibiscus syriacus]|uniref:Transcription factor MYB46 n=1 Tax=Hibiscus syriacus TaxID=106335 RepID=A0A6A2YJZ4_HIBSY|nr:Transcription factor MYB46 [Hibiscus syriacus]
MSNNSDGVREDGMVLKKGPWTATEDALLAEYVKTNGEGNWNSIHKNTRLARCGKSCRLRWANHLRPNLKKVAFSPQEERMIIKLHAKMGNKWVKMATQMDYLLLLVLMCFREELTMKSRIIGTQELREGNAKAFLFTRLIFIPLFSVPPPPSPPSPLAVADATPCSSSQHLHHRNLLFSFQTPIMSLYTSMMPSSLHPLHIPHRVPPQNFLYNPHSAATMSQPTNLHNPNLASTPPPLNSPSGSTPPPPISPLPSPTTNHLSQLSLSSIMISSIATSGSSMMTSKATTTAIASCYHFQICKTTQTKSSGIGSRSQWRRQQGNSERDEQYCNSTKEEEEDYSKLINENGPTSMGMAINEWCKDSGESSNWQPSAITDNENQLALDMHDMSSLFSVDHISPTHAAAVRSSSVRS